MRTMKKNKQVMYYSVPQGVQPIYKRDADGNIIYITVDGENIPEETGESASVYGEPKKFYGAIFAQLQNAIVRAWGSDNSKNYATLLVAKNSYPELENGVRIWRKSEVEYKNGVVDKDSADYIIEGVLDEYLNQDSYYLRKLDHPIIE